MLWEIVKFVLGLGVPAYFAWLRHRETVRGQVAQAHLASERLMLESHQLAERNEELEAENIDLRMQLRDAENKIAELQRGGK
jgi:hypothetical protein